MYYTSIPARQYVSGKDLLLSLPYQRSFLSHSATLYRRNLAISIDFYSLDIRSSDWDSFYRFCSNGYGIWYLDNIVSCWRQTTTNISKSFELDEAIYNLAIWSRIYCFKEQTLHDRCAIIIACNLCILRSIHNDLLLCLRMRPLLFLPYLLKSVLRYPISYSLLPIYITHKLLLHSLVPLA